MKNELNEYFSIPNSFYNKISLASSNYIMMKQFVEYALQEKGHIMSENNRNLLFLCRNKINTRLDTINHL